SRYTGQEDVAVGTAVANRGRVEVEALVGFFVNTLVLRSDLSGNPTFSELLARVRATVLGAYAHQELPFERLVDEIAPRRDLSRTPLFQVMLVMQNLSAAEMRLGELEVEPLELGNGGAKFDLMLTLDERAESIQADLEFRTDVFSRAMVERLSEHFLNLLERCATADARVRVGELELTSATERARLLEMSNPAARPYTVEPLHESFRRQARRTPDAFAVEDDVRSYTYAELDGHSDRIARALKRAGVGRGALIGLCLERGVELVAAIFGVLKAGAAYVPLDPEYPAERLHYMIGDAEAAAVVTDERLSASTLAACPAPKLFVAELLADCDAACADLSEVSDETSLEVSNEKLPAVSVEELAYVIYTSGSTGKPKGVAVSHAALSNHMAWLCETFEIREEDRVLQKTAMSFDASVWEFYAPLLVGGTLLMASAGAHRDPFVLIENIRRKRATILQVVPTMLDLLVNQFGWTECESLRLVFCGGEALSETLRRKFAETTPRAELSNLYGPTEATIDATYWRSSDDTPLCIGRPVANASAYILDAWGALCPVGVPGELYLGGAGLARGYIGRPELTVERFVPHPFATSPGVRLYRTGDVAKWRADGQLDFIGRADAQVKLRGHRIELGEIEALMSRHAGVRQCAAVVRVQSGSGDALVAYVAGEVEAHELRTHLAQQLPAYMVPQRIVKLDALPLTANGKIDRKALPAPDETQTETAGGYVPPRNSVEGVLCRVWSEVLGREQVGIHDNFFELGGDSILSIQIGVRAAQHGLTLSTRDLFEHQTIAALSQSAALEIAAGNDADAETSGDWPLTPIQRWFFAQQMQRPAHYNQAALLSDSEVLDGRRLQAAVEHVLAAHEVLGLRYERVDGEVRQQYRARAEREETTQRRCGRADLRSLPQTAQSRVIETIAERVQESLDLETGRLVNAVRFEVTGGGRLLVVAHHLVIDGVSWRILLDQMERSYREGTHNDLRAQVSSFGQWARRLELEARSEETQRELAYWMKQQPRVDEHVPRDFEAGANTVESSESVAVEFDAEQTEVLLREVPRHLRAQVEEALLLGVVEALREWSGKSEAVVEYEGHGREPLAGVDVSQTVGWFTTLYPVRFVLEGEATIAERLREVRDQLRAVPRKGLGYGLLKYVGGGGELQGASAEVVFNYLGQWDANLGGLFRASAENVGASQWGGERRSHVIEIYGSVHGGRLRMVWTYSRNVHRRETVERVAGLFRQTVEAVVAACAQEGAAASVPGDYAWDLETDDFSLSNAELDDLLAEVGARE
ncbi:MAG TPA: amino acid adenylation domain-containing protein, partial [Pyrinomonadaceae bacterium]|nr:amino acid adenylation domain-containing protein [Pyrinomonadaceae bacterium]